LAGFGFSLTILSLANAGILDQRTAPMFVPVAMGTGALAMLVGAIWEFRRNNLFGATFCGAYACFLFTTALIVQFYGPMITDAAGAANFRHMFGAYLIVWALFTAMLSVGARYVNAPAFTAFVLLIVVYVLLGIGNPSIRQAPRTPSPRRAAGSAWSTPWPRSTSAGRSSSTT
jgi:succinate-acetate transporter protein